MDKHIQLVGILNIVYRAVLMVGGCILLALGSWLGRFMTDLIEWGSLENRDIPPPMIVDMISVILFIVATMMILVSIVGIFGAIGVLKKKEWGRILTLVVSCVNLLHIPLGTALGVYSIWALMKDETVRIFNPGMGHQ